MFKLITKFLQCSALTIIFPLFIVPVGIANDADIDEEGDECCDSPVEAEDVIMEITELAAKFMGFDDEETASFFEENVRIFTN